MATQVFQVRQPGMMFGITHALDGSPIVREPKLLKVGIGLPKGPAINVWINREGKWKMRVGFKKDEIKEFSFEGRAQAEQAYREFKPQAPSCPYPRKSAYFTFTRQIADGTFEPDFAAVEAHGPIPTEIDVVFFDDNPLDASYQMWSTSELRCKGDGLNAERILVLAETTEEKQLAEQAQAFGSRYFPIVEGCWVKGCKYSRETVDGRGKPQPSPCKPGGDLKFQLAKNLRVGGTAYFHTTGFRSISQLFSCLYRFKCLTGGGVPERGYLVGIPFKMVLKPYPTKHNGQSATQYGVSLEFRAETIDALVKNMIEQGMQFRRAMQLAAPAPQPPQRAITAPSPMLTATTDEEESDGMIAEGEDESAQARAMSDEFYPEVDGAAVIDDGEEPTLGTPSERAAEVTQERTSALREKLAAARTGAKQPAPAPAPAQATAPPAAGAPPADDASAKVQAELEALRKKQSTAAGTNGKQAPASQAPQSGPKPGDMF